MPNVEDDGIKQILQRDIPPRVVRYLVLVAWTLVGLGLGAGGLAVWDVLWSYPQLRHEVADNGRAIAAIQDDIRKRPSPESLSRCGERIAVLENARAADDLQVTRLWSAVDECRRMRQ